MFLMHPLSEASQFQDSAKRMAWVASAIIGSFYQIIERLKKPFNPLLGETYELVTSEFRYYSEMVSHHPPIFCVNGQGKNYEMNFTGECVIKFTGKKITCLDQNPREVTLYLPDGTKETYKCVPIQVLVGNLFLGQTFVEPVGKAMIICESTGDICEYECKKRG